MWPSPPSVVVITLSTRRSAANCPSRNIRMSEPSRLGDAGVIIEVIYMAVDNHLAVVPNDLTKAQAALTS